MSVKRLHEEVLAVLADRKHGEVRQGEAAVALLSLAFFLVKSNPIELALVRATWERLTASGELPS